MAIVRQAVRIDVVSPSLTYLGRAAIGSSEGDPVWSISQITTTGTVTSILYSSGNTAYSSVWANRASLSYS